jgi:hypothetical protein
MSKLDNRRVNLGIIRLYIMVIVVVKSIFYLVRINFQCRQDKENPCNQHKNKSTL